MAFLVSIALVSVVAGLLVCLLWSYQRTVIDEFNEKWPPISDGEFLAKCSPGVDTKRALRVRRIIAEQTGIPYERIHPEQHFVYDLMA